MQSYPLWLEIRHILDNIKNSIAPEVVIEIQDEEEDSVDKSLELLDESSFHQLLHNPI